MMKTIAIVLTLVSAAFAARYNKLEWKDCNGDPNRAIRFNSVSARPDIVKIPGDLTGSFDVDITRDLTGKSELKVTIQKHLRLFGLRRIPCVFNWGSCTYDPCELVKPWATNGCPQELSNHNIPCTCPFPKTKARMVNQMFKLPDLPWYLDWLAKGDYKVEAKLYEKTTGEQLGCFEASFSVEP